MDPDFETLRDLTKRQPGAVEFWSHAAATNALPRAPDFMFGALPDEFGKIYYRQSNLWAIGIYRARGFNVVGAHTLEKDGEVFACPDANIHQAYQKDFLTTFGDLTKPRQRVFVPGQAVLLAGPGYRVYGHWISDILPKVYLLHAAGVDVLKMKILLPNDVPRFGLAWLELLGISPENLIRCHPTDQSVWVEELLVPTTFHNGVRMAPELKPAAALLSQMIEPRYDAAPVERSNQRLFLSRGQAPQNRVIRDRERLEELAVRAGLTVVHPQNLPLLEQVRLFQSAAMVVGEYGSALHGTLFSPPGAIVCALRGSLEHPGFVQSGFGHALDQPTGYVFGRNESTDMHSEFVVPEAAFTECLELLMRSERVDTFPAPGWPQEGQQWR
jgi:capsular polysaccharide biosynthesis protein